ncbi:hypothetical protein BU15DRAFT_7126, partial [Melanogaster broomeanus]
SWGDEALNWALITAITDDEKICQGLYPAPGGNVSTKDGGGKPKTFWQYQLAVAIFANHPT